LTWREAESKTCTSGTEFASVRGIDLLNIARFHVVSEPKRAGRGSVPNILCIQESITVNRDRQITDSGLETLIEVKTTTGPKSSPFWLTANELECANEVPGTYRIYRLFRFSTNARVYRVRGPLEDRLDLRPKVFLATRCGAGPS
jgi:hypothetical protein